MSVEQIFEGKGGTLCIKITGAASTANAGLGAFANPFGKSVLIARATLYFKSASTGAANLSVGVTTVAAAATDIINALAVNGVSEGDCYNGFAMQNTAKTAISAPALWTSDKYITLTGDATTVGLEAYLYLECIPVP